MKKKFLIAVSYLLILALGIVGTLAYLTDRDAKVNVFTSGDVEIKLNDEFQQGAQLLPGKDIQKKVSITNTGDNDAYVWVTIAIPSVLDSEDASKNVLHFNYSNESVEEGRWTWKKQNGEWNVATQQIDGEYYNVYTVLHQTALAPELTTADAIHKLYLDTHVDYNKNDGKYYWVENGNVTLIDYDIADTAVYVAAYAIQADQFNNVYDAYDAYGVQWGENGGVEYVAEVNTADGLAAALAKGGKIALLNDITITEPFEISEGVAVDLDLNGKTLSGTAVKQVNVLVNRGTLNIVGGTIASLGNDGGSAINNYGTLTVTDATLKGAPYAGIDGWWPSYAVNNRGGEVTINNSTVTAQHGGVSTSNNGVTTLNNVNASVGKNGVTNAAVYTSGGGSVVINGGTYANVATDQNATGASVINGAVTVNSGTFTGRIENYYGTPVIKGGTFNQNPSKYVAAGYQVIEDNGNGTYTVVDVSGKTLVSDGYYIDDSKNHYVYNANGLIAMREAFGTWAADTLAGKSINIMGDINAAGKTWKTATILSGSSSRNGFTFNGNGHTISNLTIVSNDATTTPGTALFTTNAGNDTPTTFKDITFDNVTVNGDVHTGILWGQMYGKLVADNVKVTNSAVTGTCNVGALVARNGDDGVSEITFKNCSVTNTKVEATGTPRTDDKAGASAFLGMALKVGVNGVSVDLKFEGNNTVDATTLSQLVTADGYQGGGIYTTANWGEASWETPVVVDSFKNYNNAN